MRRVEPNDSLETKTDKQSEYLAASLAKTAKKLMHKGADPTVLAMLFIGFGAKWLAAIATPQLAAEVCRRTAERYAALDSANASEPPPTPNLRIVK